MLKRFGNFNKPRVFIYCFFVLGIIFTGAYDSSAFSMGEQVPNITQGELLDLNSLTTQWLNINGKLSAISLINGKIAVYEAEDGQLQNWVKTQEFGPSDILFTTFQVKDINNDGVVEIIAGTAEPGFIYIYKLNNGHWELFNYGKYVWSAITYIAVGNFGSEPGNDILVQNQEGSLYLLKLGENSLDLVWKSPTVWRPIVSGYAVDIDHDAQDELVVVYKTGGIGVLKIVNNAAVSVWENYLWGKVMTMTTGDWEHDGQPEVLLSTSQKVIYALGWNANGGYQFEGQWTELNYVIENFVFFQNNGNSQLLATDTAGKLHLLEYEATKKIWQEGYIVPTGRIAQIITADSKTALLWGYNRKLITLQTYPTQEIKLNYQSVDYQLIPAATFQKETLYLSPKALQEIPELNLTYKNNKTSFLITQGELKVEVLKKDLTVKVNNKLVPNTGLPIVANGELQLSLANYQSLFNLNLTFDAMNKLVLLKEKTNPSAE
ncbi:MAG TPA: hypothetical protein DDW65_17460 [Firmicutes bacterium]|nr:hypothetical protein [Bacillota bacterium]